MNADSCDPKMRFEADNEFADGLYAEGYEWAAPRDTAFRCHEDLSKLYSWATYCGTALGRLHEQSRLWKISHFADDETLVRCSYVRNFVASIVAVAVAQQQFLALQDSLGDVAEELAACRLVEIPRNDALPTVAGRPYPSVLEGLLDVQRRVAAHVDPIGRRILSVMASVLPAEMSSDLRYAPHYAGHAASETIPDDGLGSDFILTLTGSHEFQEAVSQAYRRDVMARVIREIRHFDQQGTIAGIKAELSVLSQARKSTAVTPNPSALIDTMDVSAVRASREPNPAKAPSPCHLKALSGYRLATENLGNGITDKEAYDWLKDRDDDRSLVSFANWSRYLREARKRLGLQKNGARLGRTGRSIVRLDEL